MALRSQKWSDNCIEECDCSLSVGTKPILPPGRRAKPNLPHNPSSEALSKQKYTTNSSKFLIIFSNISQQILLFFPPHSNI